MTTSFGLTELWATEMPEVNSREFLVGVSAIVNAPLQAGGTVMLLNNGDEIFPAMLAAMREAKQTINFTVYIWEPGKVSDQFFEVLTERARAGGQDQAPHRGRRARLPLSSDTAGWLDPLPPPESPPRDRDRRRRIQSRLAARRCA